MRDNLKVAYWVGVGVALGMNLALWCNGFTIGVRNVAMLIIAIGLSAGSWVTVGFWLGAAVDAILKWFAVFPLVP